MGRPKTEVGVGSSNVNFATLWLSCWRLTSLNSLKFSGSRQPKSTYDKVSNLIRKQHSNKTQRKEEFTWKQRHILGLNKLTLQGQKKVNSLLKFALAQKNPFAKENTRFQILKLAKCNILAK